MKIAFIGNFDVDYTTETHHKKTFEKLGHEVIPIQENRTSVSEILQKGSDCQMVYWTHTHGWKIGSPKEIKWMFEYFKQRSIPTVGFHLDLWLGLNREQDLHTDPYWGIEHFFTVDKLMADWLNENTHTKGYYLPAGVFEDECYLGTPDRAKYPHEIVFTGSKGYHKEYPYRGQLIDWLHSTYGNRFAHYGGGGLSGLRGQELNNLYASAKIVIGDTLCKNFDYPFYYSDRLFEVTGRGGFLIFPNIKGVDYCFNRDTGEISNPEIGWYTLNQFNQLKGKIDYYLSHDEEREAIRIAGHQRTKREHTYTHRLQSIIKTLGL